jgi:hypothetical protein
MRHVISLIALTAAVAGMGLPLRAGTQASTPAAGTNQATPTPVVPLTPATKEPTKSPGRHLDDARNVLGEIPSIQRPADVRDNLARLRKAFDGMASGYATGAPVPGGPKDNVTPTPAEWLNEFFDVERDLANLIGGSTVVVPEPTTSATTKGSRASGTATPGTAPGATGTAGTLDAVKTASSDMAASSIPTAAATQGADAISPTGLQGVDPALRAALERFRLDVELFFESTTLDQH